MTLAPGSSDPAARRLLSDLAIPPEPRTLIVSAGRGETELDGLAAWLERPEADAARVLVVSALGSHPDARSVRLRALWRIEELARASGRPLLVLRLAPLLGPTSPLWLRLRARPRLPRRGQALLCPVDESDVRLALARALSGKARWEGWFEIVGPEPLTLLELASLARRTGPALATEAGAWEPPLEELDEDRLADSAPWIAHFGVQPGLISERAGGWA